MTRANVLEDVLRHRAADVEVDAGALAAILSAPPPQSSQATTPTPSTSSGAGVPASAAASPTAPAAAHAGSAGAVASGGLGFLAKGAIVLVAVAVLAVATLAALPSVVPTCPAQGQANDLLNELIAQEIDFAPAVDDLGVSPTNPMVDLGCPDEISSVDAVIGSATSGDNALLLENRRVELEDLLGRAATPEASTAIACLDRATEAVGLGTIADLVSEGGDWIAECEKALTNVGG